MAMAAAKGIVAIDADGALLREILRRVVAAIDPDRVILFGSRARDGARGDSDFDLLAVKAAATRTLLLEQAAYSALLGIAASVDILVETPERLEQMRNTPGLVFGEALRDGVTVYERPAR